MRLRRTGKRGRIARWGGVEARSRCWTGSNPGTSGSAWWQRLGPIHSSHIFRTRWLDRHSERRRTRPTPMGTLRGVRYFASVVVDQPRRWICGDPRVVLARGRDASDDIDVLHAAWFSPCRWLASRSSSSVIANGTTARLRQGYGGHPSLGLAALDERRMEAGGIEPPSEGG